MWSPAAESRFLADAWARARLDEGPYARLFLQYLRAKALLFRYLVVRPEKVGLPNFAVSYDRLKEYPTKGTAKDAAGLCGDEINLSVRSVELRTTPRTWLDWSDGDRTAGTASEEWAWVLHFVRSGSVTAQLERRVGDISRRLRQNAEDAWRLAETIRLRPELLRNVRGLDLAGVEREGPLWRFLNIIRAVRAASRAAATRYGKGVEPLRLTLHAGEDFDHLATGLRAVHEPFVWKILERGDRLGHATALGIRPKDWSSWLRDADREKQVVMMRPWDRLLDIGWLRHARHVFVGRDLGAHDRTRLSAEAVALLSRVGVHTAGGHRVVHANALETCEQLWLELGTQDEKRAFGLNVYSRWGERVPPYMLERSLPVCMYADSELMEEAQGYLASLVARSGIAIEINPSSNMLIAGMPSAVTQPMFQLRPISPTQDDVQALSISTDDPITFATCLSDEFAYAWASLVVGMGVAPHFARAWLEDAARTSVRVRFHTPVLGGDAGRPGQAGRRHVADR